MKLNLNEDTEQHETIENNLLNEDTDAGIEAINALQDIENIDIKTELKKTFALAVLSELSEYMTNKGLKDTGTNLANIIQKYKTHQVSKDRKGREEIVETIKTLNHNNKQEDDISKWLKPPE